MQVRACRRVVRQSCLGAALSRMVGHRANRGHERWRQQRGRRRVEVQVIARAAAILRSLEDQPSGLSLGQIAQRVGLARSTVQRIVSALEVEKLVIAASPTGRVRLGPAILRLATSVQTDFVTIARPFMVKLSNELRETVDVASVKRDHLVFIDQVVGPQRLRTVSGVERRFRSIARPTARPIWRSSATRSSSA